MEFWGHFKLLSKVYDGNIALPGDDDSLFLWVYLSWPGSPQEPIMGSPGQLLKHEALLFIVNFSWLRSQFFICLDQVDGHDSKVKYFM